MKSTARTSFRNLPAIAIAACGAVLLTASMVTAQPAAGSGPDAGDSRILAEARAARAKAEKQLADERAQQVAERRQLTTEIHALYEQIAEARATAKTLAADADALHDAHATVAHEAAQAARRTAQMVEQLSAAFDAEFDAGTIADTRGEISEARAARLDGLLASRQPRRVTMEVFGRDGIPARVPTLWLTDAMGVAGSVSEATCGPLRQLDTGEWRVVDAPLTPAQMAAIREATAGNLAMLPLDVSGTLSGVARAEPWSLGAWLAAGGFFVWPILVLAAIAVILAAERSVALVAMRAPATLANEVFTTLRRNGATTARPLTTAGNTPMHIVLRAVVDTFAQPHEAREAALEAALLAEEPRLERSLTLLAAIAAVAPLLGLLGTVTGMIATFDVIAAHGTGDPRRLSGGISVALITTQLGLLVAVPVLIAHAWISRIVERRQVALEQVATAALGEDFGGAAAISSIVSAEAVLPLESLRIMTPSPTETLPEVTGLSPADPLPEDRGKGAGNE